MVDKVVVYDGSNLTFHFKDGTGGCIGQFNI